MLTGLREMKEKKLKNLLNTSVNGTYKNEEVRLFAVELHLLDEVINYIENYDS